MLVMTIGNVGKQFRQTKKQFGKTKKQFGK